MKIRWNQLRKVRSPMNSYPSDESIRPEQEQPKLDSEIDSEGISNTPSESTPQLAVDLESETRRMVATNQLLSESRIDDECCRKQGRGDSIKRQSGGNKTQTVHAN